MTCLLKILGQIQCAKVGSSSVCLEIRFFDTYLGVQFRPSPCNFISRQSDFPDPSQTFLEERKEMTFDRRLANITGPVLVFRGLYCPSSENLMKKALHKITAFNLFYPIVGSLATPQRHIITSTDS